MDWIMIIALVLWGISWQLYLLTEDTSAHKIFVWLFRGAASALAVVSILNIIFASTVFEIVVSVIIVMIAVLSIVGEVWLADYKRKTKREMEEARQKFEACEEAYRQIMAIEANSPQEWDRQFEQIVRSLGLEKEFKLK